MVSGDELLARISPVMLGRWLKESAVRQGGFIALKAVVVAAEDKIHRMGLQLDAVGVKYDEDGLTATSAVVFSWFDNVGQNECKSIKFYAGRREAAKGLQAPAFKREKNRIVFDALKKADEAGWPLRLEWVALPQKEKDEIPVLVVHVVLVEDGPFDAWFVIED